MGISTQRDIDCPICLQAGTDPAGRTAYVALVPYAGGEGESLHIVEPHRYAVCQGCYLAQWAIVYPNDSPPELTEMPDLRSARGPIGHVDTAE